MGVTIRFSKIEVVFVIGLGECIRVGGGVDFDSGVYAAFVSNTETVFIRFRRGKRNDVADGSYLNTKNRGVFGEGGSWQEVKENSQRDLYENFFHRGIYPFLSRYLVMV